jgi:hypothetical protein
MCLPEQLTLNGSTAMNDHPLLTILGNNNQLHTEEEATAFDQAMMKLEAEPRDPRLLLNALLIFNDAAEIKDVMQTFIHYVESFDMKEDVQALIQVTPAPSQQTASWLRHLYVRIRNNRDCRDCLKTNLPSFPRANQEAVRQTLIALAARVTEFPKVDARRRRRVKDIISALPST